MFFQKLSSFEQNSDDDYELSKLIDLEEENIQDDKIVKAKIALKEAHSFFGQRSRLLYYTTNIQLLQKVQHFNSFLTFRSGRRATDEWIYSLRI